MTATSASDDTRGRRRQPIEVSPTPTVDPNAIGLYATWGKRFGAWLLDAVVVWAGIAALGYAAGGSTTYLGFAVAPLYFTLCHGGERGQTLGKRVLRIAVRDRASLGRVSYAKALGRWLITALFWVFAMIPGILDGLSPLWRADRRSWHDSVAGTVVITVE